MANQLDLFGHTTCTIQISEIGGKDFAFFSKSTNIINNNFKDVVDLYNKENKTKQFYHLSPSFNTIINNKDYKFIIVEIDGQTYYYPYKVVQIVKTKQIRFFDIPVSYTKSFEENDFGIAKRIITELSTLDFVRFVYKKQFTVYFNDLKNRKQTRLKSFDEFYYYIKDKDCLYENNKWKRKHYVNLLLSSKDFVIDCSSVLNKKETMDLRKEWMDGMSLKHDNVRPSTERAFERFVSFGCCGKNIKILSIYYKKKIIAQEIFLIDENARLCESLYCTHIFDYGNDIVLKHIVNRMVAIQKFVSWKYLKEYVDVVYIGTGSNNNLYDHKRRTTDGLIEYYIC